MQPAVLLWDFGDTLVDERWMRRAPAGYPGWEAAWFEVMASFAERWNVGAVRAPEVFAALAERTGMTAAAVAAHARECCARIAFNANVWSIATQRRFPQALVTVNPDLFEDFVVPAYGLAATFDTIVTSSAERTTDKPTLCLIALDRIGFHGDRSHALLIDNRLDLVSAWRDVGGAGYWFQNDEQFGRDTPQLLGLPRQAD